MTEKLTDQSLAAAPSQLGDLAMETASDMPSPIGERIPLSNGEVLERLNPALLEQLQAADQRVHYFPADLETAQKANRGYAFYRSVVDRLGKQVRADFPNDDVLVRGTVAAVVKRFPYWDVDQSDMSPEMNTVINILALGSDNGSDRVRVGGIEDDDSLNPETQEWLNNHFSAAMLEVEDDADREQTFPVLLVYESSAFANAPGHGWNKLAGEPEQRLAAVYITDKIS